MLPDRYTFRHWHHDLNAEKTCRLDLYTDLDGLGEGAAEQSKVRRMVTFARSALAFSKVKIAISVLT